MENFDGIVTPNEPSSVTANTPLVCGQVHGKGRVFFVKNIEDSKEVNKFLEKLDIDNTQYTTYFYCYTDAYEPNVLVIISF